MEESGFTLQQMLDLPMTFSLKTAARALGIGERQAYELAAADKFPIRLRGGKGRKYIATRPDLFRYYGLDPAMVAAPPASQASTA